MVQKSGNFFRSFLVGGGVQTLPSYFFLIFSLDVMLSLSKHDSGHVPRIMLRQAQHDNGEIFDQTSIIKFSLQDNARAARA